MLTMPGFSVQDPVADLAMEVGTDLVLIVVFVREVHRFLSSAVFIPSSSSLYPISSLPILLFSPETPGSKSVSV